MDVETFVILAEARAAADVALEHQRLDMAVAGLMLLATVVCFIAYRRVTKKRERVFRERF